MSKNFYIGIGGKAREGQELYVGIGGRARKVKSGYVGVNGVARKFWPNTIYVWNRYAIGSKTVYEYVRESRQEARWQTIASGYGILYTTQDPSQIFNKDTGVFSPLTYERFYRSNAETFVGNFCVLAGTDSGQRYASVLYLLSDWKNASSGGYQLYRTDRAASNSSEVPAPGAYIDQVFSENSSQYPQNGIQGNYWYVYQGIQE